MAIVYLGLGSNIEPRKQYIHQALEELKHAKVNILKISHLIETDPVGGPAGQGKYFNAAAKAETELSPDKLLSVIHHIENELGRVRKEKDGPRTIDIDILLYDSLIIQTDRLILPHPRMWEREFVTIPLKEVAPELFTNHDPSCKCGGH